MEMSLRCLGRITRSMHGLRALVPPLAIPVLPREYWERNCQEYEYRYIRLPPPPPQHAYSTTLARLAVRRLKTHRSDLHTHDFKLGTSQFENTPGQTFTSKICLVGPSPSTGSPKVTTHFSHNHEGNRACLSSAKSEPCDNGGTCE